MMSTHVGGQHIQYRPLPYAHFSISLSSPGLDLTNAGQDGPSSGRSTANREVSQALQSRLDGARVLLVEDEAIVALDIKFALSDVGADVLGPAATLSDALSYAQEAERIDGAILDIDLGGEDVLQLADLLVARSVPFVFHSGGPPLADLESLFPGAPLLRKPMAVEDLLQSLAHRMRSSAT